MQKLLMTLLVLVIVLSGCGKVKEAREAVESVSRTMEAAKDVAKSAESVSKSISAGKAVELTEAALRRYYGAVAKLREKYPEIEFENPILAAVQAGSSGKDLEKLVKSETNISFDEYNGTFAAIMSIMVQSAAVAAPEMIVEQMSSVVQELEKTDTSQMDAEQKKTFDQQLETQKKAIEEAKAKIATEEFQEMKRQVEMIRRVREEMGFD